MLHIHPITRYIRDFFRNTWAILLPFRVGGACEFDDRKIFINSQPAKKIFLDSNAKQHSSVMHYYQLLHYSNFYIQHQHRSHKLDNGIDSFGGDAAVVSLITRHSAESLLAPWCTPTGKIIIYLHSLKDDDAKIAQKKLYAKISTGFSCFVQQRHR